jgi:hypothetical protein
MENESKEHDENDPLGLEEVDRQIRIEKLRQEIGEVTGGEMTEGHVGNADSRTTEAFLDHVLALETHGSVRPLDILMEKDGLQLPPPDSLDADALHTTLWELIRAMAKRRLVLHNTNHLSDRELYAYLLEEGLREEMMGFGLPFGNCHLDLIGSGSEEDIELNLRYYADDKERAWWAEGWPDDPLPPREKPPYDRDRQLPKADDS